MNAETITATRDRINGLVAGALDLARKASTSDDWNAVQEDLEAAAGLASRLADELALAEEGDDPSAPAAPAPGTTWAPAGEGSTYRAIRAALLAHHGEIRTTDFPGLAGRLDLEDRADIRLTGAPLTDDDLARIAKAKPAPRPCRQDIRTGPLAGRQCELLADHRGLCTIARGGR